METKLPKNHSTSGKPPRTARKVVIGGLVAANVLLAGSLAARHGHSPEPQVQAAASAMVQVRRPGDYLAIGADVGQPAAVIYVLDSANGELTAVAYDENNERLQSQRPIKLNPIFDAALQQQGGRRR
ncbi:MAG: hypothetical protein ACFCVE_11095 [Phycisphaerae bacterium]